MEGIEVSVLPKGEINSILQKVDRIENYLKEIQKNLQPKKPEEYLTRLETATLLRISSSTLWDWTRKGKLQSFGLSGKVYYKRTQIEAAIIKL